MMAVLSDLIDDVLSRLQDTGMRLFGRDEVARWLVEGYRRLTYNGRHAKTFTCFDLPPRHTAAITFNWERNLASGTWRKWTHSANRSEFTFLWEIMQRSGVSPEPAGGVSVSNLWELAYVDSNVDTFYRFMMPKHEANILTIWHDEQKLSPTTSRTLDSTEDKWWQIGGEPFAYHQTLGNDNQFDVWEIDTAYHQSFELIGGEMGIARAWFEDDHSFHTESMISSWSYGYSWDGEPQATDGESLAGIGRKFTFGPDPDGYHYTHQWEGDVHPAQDEAAAFTNWFEAEVITYLPCGFFRRGLSTERQYFPSHQWSVSGLMRKSGKTDNALLVHHTVYADEKVDEQDTLDLIPGQLSKYLVYYALGILLNQQGEGYDAALAGHYEMRAGRAVPLLRKLAMISRMDTQYVRGGGVRGRTEPPLPSLPSNFPRAPWLRR